jgi:protein TonB
MQTVEHAIATMRPKGMTPQRATGLAFAGLLQVALIWALVEGLDIKVWPQPEHRTWIDIIKEPAKPGPKPPPAPPWREPAVSNPVKPIIDIDTGEPSRGITTVLGPATPSYDQAATGIAGTHNTPPYPPLALHLGEEGSLRLHLTISPQGIVTEAQVMRSSGYDDLDQAARNWIMAHWRYRSAMRGGAAVASTCDVQVRFDLKHAH